MPEDRSLDEFARGPNDDDAGDAEDTEDVKDSENAKDDEGNTPAEDVASDDTSSVASDEDVASDDEIDPVATDDVDPATTTSAWTGGGRRCERCGETVRRLWGADGTLVCPECKEW